MRKLMTLMVLGLAGCTPAMGGRMLEPAPTLEAVQPASASSTFEPDGPFTGVWQDCDEGESRDSCSSYELAQRGDRICGVWSYTASYDGYEGRLIAQAKSRVEARRTRVCGRPGSETRIECEAGWEPIDRPLRLCDGKLMDVEAENGACRARYEQASGELPAQLMAQSWIQECLAGEEETGP